ERNRLLSPQLEGSRAKSRARLRNNDHQTPNQSQPQNNQPHNDQTKSCDDHHDH
ncbi:8101_t:CDS:1, partial [Racocetra persica]